jgi:hypothetical protein
VACGELLPDAPLPAASLAPFFRLEGSGGRSITGVGQKLTFLWSPHAVPVTVELREIQLVGLWRRSFMEGLLLGVAVFILTMVFRWPWPVLAVGLGLVLVLVGSLRSTALWVKTHEGKELRWSLGLLWRGSQKLRALDAAWDAQSEELVARYEAARGASDSRDSGA